MAIDTPQKRRSALHLRMPWRGPASVASGADTAAKRAAGAGHYSGFQDAGDVAGTGENYPVHRRRRRAR